MVTSSLVLKEDGKCSRSKRTSNNNLQSKIDKTYYLDNKTTNKKFEEGNRYSKNNTIRDKSLSIDPHRNSIEKILDQTQMLSLISKGKDIQTEVNIFWQGFDRYGQTR